MEELLQEIEQALKLKLYLMALQTTLTLPDICSNIEYPNMRNKVRERYVMWFNNNIATQAFKPKPNLFLEAEDCYMARCGIVHQAIANHERMTKYERLFFVLPSQVTICNCAIGNIGVNDLEDFCSLVISSVRKWEIYIQNRNDYQLLIKDIIRYRQGLEPAFHIEPPIKYIG